MSLLSIEKRKFLKLPMPRWSALIIAAAALATMAGMSFAQTTTSPARSALEIAQDYVRFIETGDREGIERSLAEDVEQIFPISSEATGEPQGLFVGKEEVLDYTYGLFRKFDNLHWPDPHWTESADGRTAFLEGRGDATVSHSGERYRNVYVTRFDIDDGQIVRIAEYANATLYESLGIEPTETEIEAVERVRGQ